MTPEGEVAVEGTREVDWETFGQQQLRNQIAMMAERWHWTPDRILRMSTRMRKSYWHRMIELVEREKRASKK